MVVKGCKSDFGDIRKIDGKNYYKNSVCRGKANAEKQAAKLKKRVMDVAPPKSFKLKCSVRIIRERQGYGVWMWSSSPPGTKMGTPPSVGSEPRKRQMYKAKKKVFDRQTYTLLSSHGAKCTAQRHAKRIRALAAGNKARVVYEGGRWVVYVKYKTKRVPPPRGKQKRREREMAKTFFD